jgi:hypothetical protein
MYSDRCSFSCSIRIWLQILGKKWRTWSNRGNTGITLRKDGKWVGISRLWLVKVDFRAKCIWYSKSARKTTSNKINFVRKKFFFFVPGCTKAQILLKKKCFSFKKKNTWFCSEFNADSNHVFFSKKLGAEKCSYRHLSFISYFSTDLIKKRF